MNDNAKKWVAALESGEFRQTTDTLNYNGAYCCLGVACRVYEKELGLEPREDLNEHGFDEDLGAYAGVREWLGLNDNEGKFVGSSLVIINDRSDNFDEVIRVIKSEPKGLFVEE